MREYLTVRQQIPVDEAGIIPAPLDNEEGEALILMDQANGRFNEIRYYITKEGESIVDRKNRLAPCCICRTPTNLVDIGFESRICSVKCAREMNKKFYEWCKEHPMEEE